MKRLYLSLCVALLLLSVSTAASPQTFSSGSTGADGAFSPSTNTALTLPANGVFNFTTVTVPAGVTVTFVKNANNTPVTILAQGNVSIAGTVSVSGGSVTSGTSATPGAGGPGGFAGGYGGVTNTIGEQGLGPGGGYPGPATTNQYLYVAVGGGGGYGTAGGQGTYNGDAAGGPAYGNDRVSPLIGGSGGGGGGGNQSLSGAAGGGGGGAILIASSTSISVTGTVSANGGTGYYSGGGSGGAIKLMANSITGSGALSAAGGAASNFAAPGGLGRIRVEGYTVTLSAGSNPQYTYGQPGSAILSNMPTLSVTSIAGVNVPANPTGSFSQPDMLLPNTTVNPVTVTVSASNIPVGTTVTVSTTPKDGATTNVTATLSGTLASSSASANVNLSTTYISVIMVTATFTMQTGMLFDGEKIQKAEVEAVPGRESKTVFVTQSGRRVNASELMARNLWVQ